MVVAGRNEGVVQFLNTDQFERIWIVVKTVNGDVKLRAIRFGKWAVHRHIPHKGRPQQIGVYTVSHAETGLNASPTLGTDSFGICAAIKYAKWLDEHITDADFEIIAQYTAQHDAGKIKEQTLRKYRAVYRRVGAVNEKLAYDFECH